MNVAFVVAVADDAAHMADCLEGVAGCARPGDQVVVVDAASRDGSDRIARAFLAAPARDPAVEWTPIELGDGARGRPGIADRIGMEAATRDLVLPLRGADRLRPAGYARTLRAARESGADLILANYLVGNAEAPERPSGAAGWTAPTGALPDEIRAVGLRWEPRRKLMRRRLAVEGLRATSGDGVAGALFHWRVCVAARRIAFVDVALVHDLAVVAEQEDAIGAGFDAYDAIRHELPPGDDALGRAALDWLLACMSRDVERIGPGGALSYAVRGAACLGAVPGALWNAATAGDAGPEVLALAALLRRGDVAAAVAGLQGAALARQVGALRGALEHLAGDARGARDAAEAVAAAARFEALRALAPEAD